MGSNVEAGFWALTLGGWEVTRVSMYDEEGVEGWRWDGPDGEEFVEIGGWDELPTVPAGVMTAYQRSL